MALSSSSKIKTVFPNVFDRLYEQVTAVTRGTNSFGMILFEFAGLSGTFERAQGSVRDGPAAAADRDRAGLDQFLDAERLKDPDQCL